MVAGMPDATPGPEEHKQGVAAQFDQLAQVYDSVIPYFATLGRALVDAAGLRPGDRVLDIAGGRGAVLLAALDAVRPGGSVEGLDLAPEMVDEPAGRPAAAGATDASGAGRRRRGPGRPRRLVRRRDLRVRHLLPARRPRGTRRLAPGAAPRRDGGDLDVPGRRRLGVDQAGGRAPHARAGRPPGIHPSPGPLGGVRAALAQAGFADVRTADISRRFVFPDLDAGHRAPEGGYELVQGAEATVATAP